MDQMVDILTKQLYTMVVKNEKSNLVKNSLDVLDMFIQGMHFDKDTKIAVQVKASSKVDFVGSVLYLSSCRYCKRWWMYYRFIKMKLHREW